MKNLVWGFVLVVLVVPLAKGASALSVFKVDPVVVGVVYDTGHEYGNVTLELVTVPAVSDFSARLDATWEGKVTVWYGCDGEILWEEIKWVCAYIDTLGWVFLHQSNATADLGFPNSLVPVGCTLVSRSYTGRVGY